jgi:hypothetical protein
MKTIFMASFILTFAMAPASAQTLTIDDALDKVIGASYSCGFADGLEHAVNEMKGTNKPYGQESCRLARQAAKRSGFLAP